MKALTICQPYAGAIMDGRKRVENRTWETNYRGELIIHAGKNRQWLKSWDDEQDGPLPESMPFGSVVGIAELTEVYNVRQKFCFYQARHLWVVDHHHASGPFCWVLENVRRLVEPIPWNGAQGLWNATDIIESDAWRNNTLVDVSPV